MRPHIFLASLRLLLLLLVVVMMMMIMVLVMVLPLDHYSVVLMTRLVVRISLRIIGVDLALSALLLFCMMIIMGSLLAGGRPHDNRGIWP